MPSKPRIAIVHDALVNTGGAERVVTYMHEAFPESPIFTSVYLPERTYAEFRHANVSTLVGGKLASSERRCKQMLPLWLWGFRHLDFKEFDIVVSSTTWGAKAIRPPKEVRHVCYCYAPFRLLWNPQSYKKSSLPIHASINQLMNLVRRPLRYLDKQVMQHVSKLATTCSNMARQIEHCYQREAQIIYAPIRLAEYNVGREAGDYYLVVSRLMSYKYVDLAILACQALRRKLIVVGDGPERAALEALATEQIHLVGRVSEAELKKLYTNCRAVIFPSDEDYGLVPLEAQASGRPVIAFRSGGVLETVVERQTGVFFDEQSVDAITEAIADFETMSFDSVAIRQTMHRFDVENFKREFRAFVLTP